MIAFTTLLGLLCLLSSFLGTFADYDWKFGNTSVWLSAAAYCDAGSYKTRTWKGASAGFVVTQVIDYKKEDVQGYIGYMSSQSTIYVVYRGSTSIADWANNLDVILTSYPKCSKCEVHKGFYKAEQSVINDVINGVKQLKAQFPSYSILVTGHSLGAAMATLTSLDLYSAGIPVRMINFGSPRVGNDQFAAYCSNTITSRSRNTHYKDMVPHIPMHERFTHISGEWYEDSKGMHQCTGYEDPNCSYQWHITSIDDHMHYLGLYMGCDAVSN